MQTTFGATAIPDTTLAKDATDILREFGSNLIYNHSVRVYLFAAEQGRRANLKFDPELLYVSAAFHDLGLSKEFSSQTERFEVDGANAVREFLTLYGVPETSIETAWQAIALHTTPGVTKYMKPEVALLFTGVGLDVLGEGFDTFPASVREEIVNAYPRIGFKEGIVKAFFGGFAHKPGTTWGTVKADVCERFIPGYHSPNFVDMIANSPFPNSAA
jgi:HD domain